jgi:hypothetical protein
MGILIRGNHARDVYVGTTRSAMHQHKRVNNVSEKFKLGGHVRWNSEAGQLSGKITQVHKKDNDREEGPHRTITF